MGGRLPLEWVADFAWNTQPRTYNKQESKESFQRDDVGYQVGPRMSHESEADYLQRQMLGQLILDQIEKRRATE